MRGCTAHTGEDAAHIVDSLMFAQLHGIDSYGLQRIPMYDRLISNPEGGVDVNTRAEVVRQTPVSAVVDGHQASVTASPPSIPRFSETRTRSSPGSPTTWTRPPHPRGVRQARVCAW